MSAAPAGLEEQLSARQEDLVRTTYRLMGDRGVRRLPLQDIADAAGVSKALLLYHFGSKQALVLATMRWVLDRAAGRIRDAVDSAGTPKGKVEAMVDAIFVGPEANLRFYSTYLDLLDHALRLEDFGRLSASFRTVVNALYEEVAGLFGPADVEESATVLRAIVDGLFIQWLQEEEPSLVHAHYREACKRAVLGYLAAA